MWHGGGASNILTRGEKGRKKIILCSQAGRRSVEIQWKRHGRMSFIRKVASGCLERVLHNPLDFYKDLIAQRRGNNPVFNEQNFHVCCGVQTQDHFEAIVQM